MGIAPEQVEHGEVGGGLAVGYGRALQHAPALRVVRVDTLIDEAGLAHPGLADHGDHLPMAGPRPLQGLHQGRELRVAADKAGEPSSRGRLQAPPDTTRTDKLKDVDRRCQALDGHGSSGVTCTYPSARLSTAWVSRIEPGRAICSMRAARCVVWPTAV